MGCTWVKHEAALAFWHRYRYMASLRLNDDPNGFFCGGTLIHPLVVLTAAHVRAGRRCCRRRCCRRCCCRRCCRRCCCRRCCCRCRRCRRCCCPAAAAAAAALITHVSRPFLPPSCPLSNPPQCLTDPYTAKNYSEVGYPNMQPPLVRVGGYWATEEPSSKAELFSVVRQASLSCRYGSLEAALA